MQDFTDDIIIHPLQAKGEQRLPEAGVLVATPKEAKAAVASMLAAGGRRHRLHFSSLATAAGGEKFAAGPVLGAPAAVLALEKLIVLGARRIVFFGWCGALSSDLRVGDVVVPDGAVSGEGTSAHYPVGEEAKPSPELRQTLSRMLSGRGVACSSGSVWTTDAPYRESRSKLAELHRLRNVVCVDMELSALAAVAAFRGAALAGVLVVSDELSRQRWRPGFKEPVFRQRCEQVIACLLAEDF